MPTRIVPPDGLICHPPGAGIQFANGSTLRPDHNGHWYLADSQVHQLDRLLAQGWRRYEEPKPKPVFRDELDRLVNEIPLATHEILRRCTADEVLIKREGSRLRIRPLRGISEELRRYIQHNASAILNELDRRQTVQWENVE
jgi:hypothetical protein